jgi:hypothetical protein
MFSGSSRVVNNKLGHFSRHVEAFGELRSQQIDTQEVRAEDGEFDDVTTDNLTVTGDLSVASLLINDGSDNIIIGTAAGQTAGTSSIVMGTSTGSGDHAISIGRDNTVNASGDYAINIGFSNTSDNLNSVAIGVGLTTRQDDEFVTRGMRMIRLTATTTNATPSTPQTIFTLENDGEMALLEGAVVANRTDAVPVGSEGVTTKYENYIIRREAGVGLVIDTGSDFINDPSTKGYTSAISASGNDVQVSVTGAAAENVSWTMVFRVWCGPL